MPEFKNRREAAQYWDTHAIGEHGEEVAIEVKKPLSTILSLRVDDDLLKRLKVLAKAQGIGVTTMARRLLYKASEKPSSQLFFQALQEKKVRNAVIKMWEESKVPPDDGDPKLFVIPATQLEHISQLLHDSVVRLLSEVLESTSVPVTPDDRELYDRLRQREEALS